MNRATLRLLLPTLFLLLAKFSLFSQPFANIVGPSQLCVGECSDYFLVFSDGSTAISAEWNANGQTISTPGSAPVLICANTPDAIFLSVTGTLPNGNAFFAETFIEVITSALNPVIVSTSTNCPAAIGSNCDQVCAYTTVVYELAEIPPGTSAIWDVVGAESYIVNGHELSVTWGASGQGKVSVKVGSLAAAPLQLFCGQNTVQQLSTGVLGGSAQAYWYGGSPPYQVVVSSGTNVAVIVATVSGNHFETDTLPPGNYIWTVTDANGNALQCDFTIVDNPQECWVSIFPTILSNPSSDQNCDGAIEVQAAPSGSGTGNTYTYQWSTGFLGAYASNLCCGSYNVSVTSSADCSQTISMILDCPSQCSATASLCVDILEHPQAGIGSVPAPVNEAVSICQGQTIFFQNQSLNASSYVWDFGDLNFSTQYNPTHTYNTPGTYAVSLIARNDCFCSDTAFLTVNVLPADLPQISCTGTVCEGETVTYSTPADCGSYNWSITGGGVILDGGGSGDDFITVQWQTGPQGFVSLEVGGCSGNVCSLPNVVPVPILSGNTQIQGPVKVCPGSAEEYFIPGYSGSDITWTVVGSGTIAAGQGSERIVVKWSGSANSNNPQLIIVEFQNCYLGCGGKDTLEVLKVPGFYAKGAIEVCQNSTKVYSSHSVENNSPINCTWQLTDTSDAVVWASAGAGSTANILFNFPPGDYILRATPASLNNFCNDFYEIFVKIDALPPQVASLNGATDICVGVPYRYEAQGLPEASFSWSATGGAPASFYGNPLNVIWGASPPYSISVIQSTTDGAGCSSAPTTLAINPIPDFNISGDDQICREGIGTYTVPSFENIDYQWAISPPNAGTIVSGQGTAGVDVLWHIDGPASLNLVACSFSKNFNLTVQLPPQPIVPDTAVCVGETVSLTTTVPFVGYAWKDELGATVSTEDSPSLGSGFYTVEVTDANGCIGKTAFEIVKKSQPVASISLSGYLGLCPGGAAVTLYATTSGYNYDYSWFQDGNPVGGNSTTLSINTPGNYQVVVSSPSGCTAGSALMSIPDCAAAGGDCDNGICAPPGSLPSCNPNGSISFSTHPTADCSTRQYQNTSTNFIPGTLQWHFYDPASGSNNSSSLENPEHTFSAPGFYYILLLGEVPDMLDPNQSCTLSALKTDTILVAANFEYGVACSGSPLEFFDYSERLDFATITAWDWDFGDASSGADNFSNLQNPTHIYAVPGTYTVKLTIAEAGGCQTSISKNITVQPPPMVSFDQPVVSCQNAVLVFDAIVSSDVNSLTWNFGDPVSGAANTSELANSFHFFSTSGTYTVSLTAADAYGCVNNFQDIVAIDSNLLAGNIALSQPSPICEGDSILLSSPSGGIAWNWSSGASSETLAILQSGIYKLTLTDAKGCSYTPPPAVVDIFGSPNSIIKGVQYNEHGQPIAFFENSLTVCEGEDVTLLVQGSLNYSYFWSSGNIGKEIGFTKDRGNLLAVGTHDFTVTVTDNATSCTSIEGPFTVVVNPNPSVQIASFPSGILCENNPATLNVNSPQPGLTYVWNTGETGASISVIAGGIYFAQAVNQYGCRSNSNDIEVQNAPSINLIPNGCHQRCDPDTMCLPTIPGVASYQWFLDGTPIPGPEGNQPNPIFTQSGDYTVAMTDIYGCESISDALSLTIDPNLGASNILGTVYFDVNGNGVIDAADTTVAGIGIFLGVGSVYLDTIWSDSNGAYLFDSLLANGYTLLLDVASLPANWTAYSDSTFLNLSGCNAMLNFNWLLGIGCTPATDTLDFQACEGDGVSFDGSYIPAGASQTFYYQAFDGCDSILTVNVIALPSDTSQLGLSACPGNTVAYGGQILTPGDVQDFIFQNQYGCDSIVTVSVSEYQATVVVIDAVACFGDSLEYNGVQIPAGSEHIFTEINADGCLDTTIVAVLALPVDFSDLSLTACGNSLATYGGQQLAAGDVQDFIFQNQFGCDSVVTVTVLGAPVDSTALTLQVCEGETVNYIGQDLLAGSVQDFVFQNQYGCDSVVTVSVLSYPSASFDLAADAICLDSDDGSIQVQSLSGGAPPYLFSIDGKNWDLETVFEDLPPGQYTVFLQDGNNCIVKKEAKINVVPPILLETQDATIVCGDSLLLAPLASSQLPLSWEWPDGSTLAEFWVKRPGSYQFTVKNDCETIVREIEVRPEPLNEGELIYMPNSFSPNGDGINDCYQGYPSPKAEIQSFVFKIFDRWGDMVFETEDLNDCWDGTFKGRQMQPAVFVWFLEMEALNCDGSAIRVFEKGDVHLMR